MLSFSCHPSALHLLPMAATLEGLLNLLLAQKHGSIAVRELSVQVLDH
jgi:hypothetical protein